jgi:small conductance mechanosensitive channel
LAIGFGAQSLVKDFVSGLFILVENQYGIGDKIKIGSFEGNVIKITMRSTVLKNKEGMIYYISNGLIKDVLNMSQ